MDRGLCGERNPSGQKASSWSRDSDYARAERYDNSRKVGGDNQKAHNNFCRDVECYRRQSERPCKFQQWIGWGRQGRWGRRYRARQAEWWRWTWLGDGHNLQHSTAPHGEFSAEADEDWRIDATGMGWRSQRLPWERYEVWDCWIEGSGGCQAPNTDDSSHTIPDNIWSADADSRNCLRKMANASSDISTRKKSNEAGFRETELTEIHTGLFAWCSTRLDTDSGCKACCTHMHLPLHKASLVYYHIEIKYGQRYGDGSCIAGDIDSQIVNFDDLSLAKANFVPTLLHVSFFLISVTKLWDRIYDQCVCKSRTGHARVLDSRSG